MSHSKTLSNILERLHNEYNHTRSKQTIHGHEVTVRTFPEAKRKTKTTMRLKGKQTHDAKITRHLGADEIQ